MQETSVTHSTRLLLRRFVFRKVEASDWWWTARDHGKVTGGRRPLSPSRLPLRAHFNRERERETSGYEAGTERYRPWGRYFYSASFCLWLALLVQGRALNYFSYDVTKRLIAGVLKQLRSHYTARTIDRHRTLVFRLHRTPCSLEVRQVLIQELTIWTPKTISFWLDVVDPIIAKCR